MSVSAFAIVKIKSQEKFQEYAGKAKETLSAYGGEVINRSKVVKKMTGNVDYDFSVVMQFPDVEKVEAWLTSPEYQSLVPLRDEGADVTISVELDIA